LLLPSVSLATIGVTEDAVNFDEEFHRLDDNKIRVMSNNRVSWLKANTWIRFDNFDFGTEATSVTAKMPGNNSIDSSEM